jgi:hypothetical protein
MSKEQMIDAIRQRNRTAGAEFLVHFKEDVLASYLKRLDLSGRRGRQSAWVREGDTPAIVTRIH